MQAQVGMKYNMIFQNLNISYQHLNNKLSIVFSPLSPFFFFFFLNNMNMTRGGIIGLSQYKTFEDI